MTMTWQSFKRMRLLAGVAAMTMMIAGPGRAAADVTPERLLKANQEQGNWLHHHKDYSAQRFTELNQINKDTVKNLRVAFTMALGGVEGGGI